MDETNDVQALEKISSEVDESQIKVILSSQCIKAQAFLLDKLRKQSERHKETCNYISSANIKLEAEIKQAEQEISSMLIAQETIRSGNVEIKKEWLMAKIRKTEIMERIENGKKKYEALWLECKSRYESIPFVQKLLCATNKADAIKKNIDGLDTQITALYEERTVKRQICKELDKKRAIELANYIVNEMPKTIEIINTKTKLINDITKEIEEISNQQNIVTDDVAVVEVVETTKSKIEEIQSEKTAKVESANKMEDDFMPKLELMNFDLDVIDVSLEKVKIMKNELPKTIPTETDYANNLRTNKIDEYREEAYDHIISPYFKPSKDHSQNYSKRKLINILEDININHNEAYNIVKKVNPEKLHKVNEISSKEGESVKEEQALPKARDTPVESEDIEEVNMSLTEDIIIPPTQFLDISLLCSQDDMTKKRVSFDIPSSVQINEIIEDVNEENESANQTASSQLDVSVASEDSYMKIKDMILKKHNLDLSPQFVYGKKSTIPKMDDDNIVTSKFFDSGNQELKTNELDENKVDKMEVQKNDREQEQKPEETENLDAPKSPAINDNILPMEVDDVMVSTPKQNKTSEDQRRENPVSGLLFTHGTQAIPDSLNASMSTTGYEDLEIPNCIDSSLLLSPKADVALPGENPEVLSQEVPNFLSGFRKAGLSFFGGPSTSEPKPDTDDQNGGNNNFSFNFGGEKKNRGGLFSLFR